MGLLRSDAGGARWTAAVCAALLAAFAALSYSAVRTKSATIDEPIHLVGAWRALRAGDYRQDVANPPLWKWWAALPAISLPPPPMRGPLARAVVFAPDEEALWSTRALFDTPGVDGVRLVNRARAMVLLLSVALGSAVAVWGWQLGGPVAAVVATAGFAFDPTVLAHAPLVKSDLAEGLTLFALAWLSWHAGRRLTVARTVGLGLLCGAAVNTKFSGLLAGPILAALLLLRSLGPTPWSEFGRVAASRPARLVAAAMTGLLAAAVCFAFTWGCYRFRYRPAPSMAAAVDMPAVYDRVRRAETSAALRRPATGAEAAAHPPGGLVRFVRWADGHHLLPQAFLAGLAHQSAAVGIWPAYLNGQVYFDGRPSYYPLAALYKTPLPELAALAAAALVGLANASGSRLRLRGPRKRKRPADRWALACVAVPALTFGLAALTAHLNTGLRAVLPLYPFAAVAVGTAAARAWRRRPRLTAFAAVALLGGQAATAIAAWPDYIPFFNAAVGGPVPGLAHLADSNLDWGQDVPALATWQRAHPGVPVYADLFLAVDPDMYGAHVHWLWQPDATGHMRLALPHRPAVIAVSATHLQGLYIDPAQRPFLAALGRRPPLDVLHGTIYLYDYHP